MSYHDLMPFQNNLILSWKVAEKIIIPGYNGAGTFCQSFNKKLSSLHIAAMDQIIKGLLHCDRSFQLLVSSVGIADNQYFHRSSSFIACRAFPLWLILFFSSIGSSAEVQPYSGRKKIGS